MKITVNKAKPVVTPPPTLTLEVSVKEMQCLTRLLGRGDGFALNSEFGCNSFEMFTQMDDALSQAIR